VSDVDAVLRLAAGGGLGALIGFEREVDGHEAGVRTHALLALGAAAFGLLSVSAFSDFTNSSAQHVNVDPSRIASYIPAGIGFLGGGVILKRHNRVRGLTTAASLWVASAVGLACGLGVWVAACAATAIALGSLLAERPIEALVRRIRGHTGHLRVEVELGSATDTIAALVDLLGPRGRVFHVERDDESTLLVLLAAGPQTRQRVQELTTAIARLPGVLAVDDGP
jgi:putative Mg2+ transporter-C (MgtC) family protein